MVCTLLKAQLSICLQEAKKTVQLFHRNSFLLLKCKVRLRRLYLLSRATDVSAKSHNHHWRLTARTLENRFWPRG